MAVSRLAHIISRLGALVAVCVLLGACENQEPHEMAPTVGLRINTVLGQTDEVDFKRAERLREFSFPQDHGAHEGYRSEWWYLTVVLQSENGDEFGLQYTLFKQALTPLPQGDNPWQTGLVYLAHLAVTDVGANRHYQDQRFSRGHPGLAGVRVDGVFKAWIEDWLLAGTVAPGFELNLQANARQFDVDLKVSQTQAIVLQGNAGLSHKGPDAASYYYSMPRLHVQGKIGLPGREVKVTGLGWLDREWSTSVLPQGVQGWDWFALQLDDQRSLMAFQLRRADGLQGEFNHGIEVLSGTSEVIGPMDAGDEKVRLLQPSDYTLEVEDYWRDERGTLWPIAWRLKLANETFLVRAMVDDQVMDEGLIYWEGLVAVTDLAGHRLGRGYLELTGYGDVDPDGADQP